MKSMQCYIKLEAVAALVSLIFNLVYVSRLFRVILSTPSSALRWVNL